MSERCLLVICELVVWMLVFENLCWRFFVYEFFENLNQVHGLMRVVMLFIFCFLLFSSI